MPYLDNSIFKSKYLDYTQSQQTTRGGYGAVFSTQTHIVKVQDSLPNFIRELNICSAYEHPCIIQVEDWTVDEINGEYIYIFSQRRGIPITEAIQKNYISLNQIIIDVYSGIKFLHSVGVIHLDIKPQNIVFLNGKATIIDFGLASYGYLYENGLFSYNNIAYTINFRDPEFSFYTFNHSDSDYYAFGVTIAYLYLLFNGLQPPVVFFDVSFIKDDNIRYICEECMKPKKTRSQNLSLTLEQSPIFLSGKFNSNIPIKNIIPGQTKSTPPIKIDKNCGNIYLDLCSAINEIMERNEFDTTARTGFLTHHLIHRTLSKVVDVNEQNFAEIAILGVSCFYLSLCIYSSSNKFYSLKDFTDKVSLQFDENDYLQMVIKILTVCDNIVSTPTLWDAAHSGEDLPYFLDATVQCDYNPNNVPQFSGGLSDKNVLFKSISREVNENLKTREAFELNIKYTNKLQIIPIFRNEPKTDYLEKLSYAANNLNSLFQAPQNQELKILENLFLLIVYRDYVNKTNINLEYILKNINMYFPKLYQKYFSG